MIFNISGNISCIIRRPHKGNFSSIKFRNFTNFISPEMKDWTRSGELIFMVVLGGAGSIFGPVLGASIFLLLEEILSGLWLYWQLVFGIFLILVVLFAKGGIDSLLSRRKAQ